MSAHRPGYNDNISMPTYEIASDMHLSNNSAIV